MSKPVSEIIWEMRNRTPVGVEHKVLTDAYDQITNHGSSYDLDTIEDALTIIEAGWKDIVFTNRQGVEILRRAWDVLHNQREILRAWDDYGCKAS